LERERNPRKGRRNTKIGTGLREEGEKKAGGKNFTGGGEEA